jgi:hypothetical protein
MKFKSIRTNFVLITIFGPFYKKEIVDFLGLLFGLYYKLDTLSI